MKKACSILLCLLLCFSLQLGAFADSANLKTVVPSTHEITVSFNYGGYILNNGRRLQNPETITVDRFANLGLDVVCLHDSHLKKVTVNGVDVTDQVRYGQLKLNEISTDMDIVFTFEKCDDAEHGGGSTNPNDPSNPGGSTNPNDPSNPGGSTNPNDPSNPGGSTNPNDPSNPGDHDHQGDPCTHMGMSGHVHRGEDPFPKAHLDFNFGDITADADKDGAYNADDVKDGFYVVEISDEDGTVAGSANFSVHVDPNATEVTVDVLEDGTQLVTVPENTEHLYLDFVVNADGTVIVVPGQAPVEPVPEEPTTEKHFITDNPVISTTGALIREYPLVAGGIFLLTFFLLLLIIARRKDEDEEEEPTRV